mmetsp:Transcript_4721/g.14296  ORF Transcript_4721/g.14296 Transcript_4721/m.14296 type:complete len:82 (+) Transcript_4721:586-831(+)
MSPYLVMALGFCRAPRIFYKLAFHSDSEAELLSGLMKSGCPKELMSRRHARPLGSTRLDACVMTGIGRIASATWQSECGGH